MKLFLTAMLIATCLGCASRQYTTVGYITQCVRESYADYSDGIAQGSIATNNAPVVHQALAAFEATLAHEPSNGHASMELLNRAADVQSEIVNSRGR